MSETLAPCPTWANLDPSVVVDNIRETTLFDADMIESMLKFAIESASSAACTAKPEPVILVDIPPGDQQAGWYPGYKFEGLRDLEPGKYRLYTTPDALKVENERLKAELAEAVDLLEKVNNHQLLNTKLVKDTDAFLVRYGAKLIGAHSRSLTKSNSTTRGES